MLIDYHMHLRPDDPDATAHAHFTRQNVQTYIDTARSRGVTEIGVSEHVHRFREALEVWDHPFWRENAHDSLDEYCGFLWQMREEGLPVRVGLEVDWVGHERMQAMRELLQGGGRQWDYVLGSIHFLGDQSFDHPDYDIWADRSADEVWSGYFSALGHAAASGLYDVIAHPDLVKVWGMQRADQPPRPLREYYELALDGLEAGGVAIEVSSAGLRKPVGEIYPDPELLRMCRERGLGVTLASDAHRPEDVAFAFDVVGRFLRDHGVDEILRFDRRERTLVKLP